MNDCLAEAAPAEGRARHGPRVSNAALQTGLSLSEQWRTEIGATLISQGSISPLAWARLLADALRLPLVDLLAEPPSPGLIRFSELRGYLAAEAVPWRYPPHADVIVAAVNPSARATQEWVMKTYPESRVGFVVISKYDLLWALQKSLDPELDDHARESLYRARPELSAKHTLSRPQIVGGLALLLSVIGSAIVAPGAALLALASAMTVLYSLTFLFRLFLTWVGARRSADVSVSRHEVSLLKDADLPVYTILVPMYREAAVLPLLVESIRRLDYPRAKLDVKLVLEADDEETQAAAKALNLEGIFEIVRVPTSLPKTKPKACNYALQLARGEFIVIYDAEDVPDPDQLKKAVVMFRRSPDHVACVQARLNFFNRDDNFLTRHFTLEYSHWFDFLLPGLDALRFPIPLGGTSNHFRTGALLRLGAWDPYNVTEDADLGLRLTQVGCRVAVLNSTTFEEANGVLNSWIKQRSRWIKGYMQTWLVHMRQPVALLRSSGFRGFIGFQLFVGFPALTALLNPVFWLVFAVNSALPSDLFPTFHPVVGFLAALNLIVGNGMSIYFGLVATVKRRWFDLTPWALTAPAYWVLHSVAAFKALWQLIVKPHYWEKTQHGSSAATREAIAQLRQVADDRPQA